MNWSRIKRLVCSASVVVYICVLGGCTRAGGRTTLQRIQQDGVVRVGYANEAPYAYIDPESGRLTGESPEIASVILGKLGVKKIHGVLTEFGALIPGLQAGRFDIIAAGMYITPKRCQKISFTRPTYRVGEAFLVRAGNPLGLHSYEDVARHPTARLGVVAGAVELSYAKAVGVPRQRVVILPDPPSAVAAVQAGRVDAYAGTALTIQDMLAKAGDKGLERASPFSNPFINGTMVFGYGAFGVRKKDQALLKVLNRQLANFIGTKQHRALVAQFGFTSAELPGNVTAAELCGNAK